MTLTLRRGRKSLTIAFLHPDLGIGGAERFVVDAAVQLQSAGHRVVIFTAHHNRTRCFDETRDGTLEVRVYGDALPLHVGQRLRAPCAIARMAYLSCAMGWRGGRFDLIFCDLVAHAIPLVKLVSSAKVLFYCHFPDRLLATQSHWLYRAYRAPINRLEAVAMRMADRVLVNSHFTAAAFRRVFPRLRSIQLEVLSPGVACHQFASNATAGNPAPDVRERETMILCIGRFERAKNLGLAVASLAALRKRLSRERFARVRLVVAGGYDERLRENRKTLHELQALARRLRLTEQIVFCCSPNDTERLALLSQCRIVVYTPVDEHFGYVPLEAMEASRPVVAVDSGGPRETVRHGETGFLCRPNPDAFAKALTALIANGDVAYRMGQLGREHVLQSFSLEVFGARLAGVVQEMVPGAGNLGGERPDTRAQSTQAPF